MRCKISLQSGSSFRSKNLPANHLRGNQVLIFIDFFDRGDYEDFLMDLALISIQLGYNLMTTHCLPEKGIRHPDLPALD